MFAFADTGRLRPLGAFVDVANNIRLASTQGAQGATIYTRHGRVGWCLGAPSADVDVDVAVQGYPVLVDGGRVIVTGEHDTESTGRVAIGIDSATNIMLAAATLPMLAFAQWMLGAGAAYAVYLDGGSKAALRTRDSAVAFGGAGALPSVIGFKSIVTSTSTGGGDAPVPAIAAAIVALLSMRRRRRR